MVAGERCAPLPAADQRVFILEGMHRDGGCHLSLRDLWTIVQMNPDFIRGIIATR